MKILVTGGAGFIGSHIVDEYLKKGHKVVIIDNLSTGFKKNINKQAKFYKIDITDLSTIRKVFKIEKPDIVNHHAAIAAVISSIKDPTLSYKVNILGTVNLLIAGGESGIKKFIFPSSCSIYGNQKKLPLAEVAEKNPVSPYALSKLIGEQLIDFYANIYGFNYVIFRYANVYGPRQNPKGEAGVVAIFSELMRNNKQPTIFGNGKKTRDYVYIKDVVNANILSLNEKLNNLIINIGTGEKISDEFVFMTLAEQIRFKNNSIYMPDRPGEVRHISVSPKLAAEILKWQPKIKFKEGIKKYLKQL